MLKKWFRKNNVRGNNRVFYSVFFRSLSVLLIAQCSGIPAALAAAKAKAPSEVEVLQNEGNRVSKELSRLVFEAKNPNTLSAGPANPAALRARAEASETSFLAFKGKLEAYLASPASKSSPEGADASAVTFYFEQAIKAVQLRALTAGGGRVEFARFDFKIPYRMLERMSGFDQVASSELVVGALADPDSMVALDRDSVRSASGEFAPEHPVNLQIGRGFASRFVLVAKAGLSDERAFVTVVKSLTLGALLDQWEQIDQVRKTPVHDLPAVPGPLASELGALGLVAERRAQGHGLAAEPDRRGAIAAGYRQWWFENDKKEAKPNLSTLSKVEQDRLRATAEASRAAGLELSDPAFLEGYLKAALGEIPDTEETQAKKAAALDSMRMSENAFIALGLGQAMVGFPLPLAGMSQVELRRALRRILAQAKFISLLPALRQLPAPEERDAQINAYLANALEAFGARVPDRTLDLWIEVAAQSPATAQAQLHREYVQEILKEAISLDAAPKQEMSPATPADFELVKRVGRMSAEYEKLRDSARADLEIILSPRDWGVSLQAYRLLLTKIAAREAAARATDPAKAKAYANETAALRAVAPNFGLRESGPFDGKLTLGELSEGTHAAYLGMSLGTTLGNSLLSVELEKGTPLFKQLAIAAKMPGTSFATAEALLERGFEVLRSNIKTGLQQLSEASSLEPKEQVGKLLPLIARSTLLKLEIPQAFPMLTEHVEAAVDTYLSGLHHRGVLAEAKEAFMRPMSGLMYIFIAKMALMLFRPTRPLARVVTALEVGINLETRGYMIAALPILIGELGIDYAEYREARHDEAETRRWFSTSADESSFFDFFSVTESEGRTTAAWEKFSSSAKQQALFLGVPMLYGMGRPFVTRLFDGWKIKKFERLGFNSPEIASSVAAAEGAASAGAKPFSWSTKEIQARATAKIAELRMSELFTTNRLARERAIQSDADSLIRFIQKQENTARAMLRDLEKEYRALGIPKGKETLNLRRLTEARSILEARYRSYEIGLPELERGRKAFDEITGAIQLTWGGSFSPIRYLFYKKLRGVEPPRGAQEAFRERLYAEIYGFADLAARESWWGTSSLPAYDLYEKLGLNPSEIRKMPPADAEKVVKSAYRRIARDTHPDTHPGDKVAETLFKEASQSYSVLSDATKKANYDAYCDRMGLHTGGQP